MNAMRRGDLDRFLGAATWALVLLPALAAQGTLIPPASAPGVSLRSHLQPAFASWRQFRAGAAHDGFNPDETVIGPDEAGQLVVLWQAQVGSSALGDGVFAPPSVLDGVVYVNSTHGTLNAFDAQTGAALWVVTTGGYGDSAPAIFGGHVLVGSVTGLQAWPVGCDGACVPDWTAGTTTVNPSLTVADGRVFAGEYSGFVRAYDLATGAPLWGAKVNSGDPVFGSPTVAGGRVFVSGDDGLYAFAADGSGAQPLWLRPTEFGCEKSPAVAGDTVFVADDQGRLYAADVASGALRWSATTSFQASSPAVADGRVFVSTGDGQLFAFPADGGGHAAPLWVASVGPGKALYEPVVANGVVWTGSIDTFYLHGTLYAFAAETGEQLAALKVDGAIESEPTVVDGRVYVGTLTGTVYAFGLP